MKGNYDFKSLLIIIVTTSKKKYIPNFILPFSHESLKPWFIVAWQAIEGNKETRSKLEFIINCCLSPEGNDITRSIEFYKGTNRLFWLSLRLMQLFPIASTFSFSVPSIYRLHAEISHTKGWFENLTDAGATSRAGLLWEITAPASPSRIRSRTALKAGPVIRATWKCSAVSQFALSAGSPYSDSTTTRSAVRRRRRAQLWVVRSADDAIDTRRLPPPGSSHSTQTRSGVYRASTWSSHAGENEYAKLVAFTKMGILRCILGHPWNREQVDEWIWV